MSRFYLIVVLFSLNQLFFAQDFTKDYLKYALEQKEKGDYVEALFYFEKALLNDSNKVDVLWNYAETLRLYKDYRKAERIYQKVYEKEETKLHLRSIFYLAEMQKMNGKYEDAIESFKIAKKKYAFDKKEYLYKKSVQEIESCLWAKKAIKDTLDIEINKLPLTINSNDSEFGHTILNNTLFFSALKGDSTLTSDEVLSSNYKTKIYSIDINSASKIENVSELNTQEHHIANGSFSLDKKRFYYSACKEIDGKLQCKIVMAYYVNGKMRSMDTLDEIINEDGANTTMPFIAKFDNNEVLFFASDRAGSIGGLDLYYCYVKDEGRIYTEPIAISEINSKDNELSPFYDQIENKLYFSSDWHFGFGGYDVFYSPFENYKFQKPINLGLPINSLANDIYYFKNKNESYFSSNRLGVNFSINPTCCSDIFYYSTEINDNKSKEINSNEDENLTQNLIANQKTIQKSEYKSLEDLNNKLPVTLYFHNDVPNPKSFDTISNLNYLTTYNDYISMIPQYKKEYAKGLNVEKATDAEEDIESFFIEFVNQGVKDLDIFRELLLKELKENKSIVITVKGFASPLAKSDYNVNLTKRRIFSLKNYLKEYNNGDFLPYLNQTDPNGTKLIIQEIPFGEYVANKLVSDNPNDMKNSIYSRAAGLERKIEIQSANYLKSDTANYLMAKNQLIDLGKIDSNKIYTKVFEIKNTGVNPIEISKIDIPCACNTVKINKKSLKSNEISTLELSFDSTGYNGNFVKSVYIYTQNSNQALRLVLTGEIK